MSLTSDQYSRGRQIEYEGETLDVLDVVTGASGDQFAIVSSEDTNGMAALLPVSLLRDEDSPFTAVDEEEREARRREQEEERQQDEERDQEEFRQWQAGRNQTETPTPSP